jgi:hypothetical protein
VCADHKIEHFFFVENDKHISSKIIIRPQTPKEFILSLLSKNCMNIDRHMHHVLFGKEIVGKYSLFQVYYYFITFIKLF